VRDQRGNGVYELAQGSEGLVSTVVSGRALDNGGEQAQRITGHWGHTVPGRSESRPISASRVGQSSPGERAYYALLMALLQYTAPV
jgi:hypothetical protein